MASKLRADEFDHYNLRGEAYINNVDQYFAGRDLLRVLWRKLVRRSGNHASGFQARLSYDGLVLFDKPELDGGGVLFGQSFFRALVQLGIGHVSAAAEVFAGPGYTGYLLLANGLCDSLTLVDVNPEAVRAAELTRERNRLESRVKVFHSNVLDAVPQTEKWDLVVCNPPHFLAKNSNDTCIKEFDPGWELHRRFYANVRKFLSPGARVVCKENASASVAEIFEPMITASGGKVVQVLEGRDVFGKKDGLYYLMSQW
jgi:16S rRNA G966 N2-methylase RsmD